ncbi:NAD-dependent epimerase/dehydratase family protein [Aliiroseovarius subalbicans]|uniref:NAD-dependent epimerase/dehydratase family protein n=1 Tax=Aliiroseovarius subalbicans TaxID=2925840 RepID=UPI001F57959F|nr:NAD-dependent epimerase/dehydratase family protein [Aliiroseovarius subalbicans]MCI2399779.1 NAD-dependent epimerase/dehydratase family protein [Aliiroseovarius subalbicans]
MTFDIDTTAPVLVTGATGYVAGWLVQALLDAGATVHAAVRDPDDAAKVKHLVDMAADAPGDIRFFRADLLAPGSYGAAMEGCGVVFHTASPFSTSVKDPQTELIDPAVNGTRNVLEQANQTGSVTRVVLTSSCAAIYTDAKDCAAAPGGRLSEEVWNTTASLDYQPYSYSKTLAERAAWEIARAQDRWRLVVVNPSLVMGPAMHDKPTSESVNILRQAGDGTFRIGAPRLGIGMVDVRDLAQAHVAAGFVEGAEGRHIISAHDTDILELVLQLRERFGAEYPLPKRALPKAMMWLMAPFVGLDRRFVAANVNVAFRSDNSKAVRALGLSYRPMRETMEDMFAQMVAAGAFDR